MKAMQHNIDNTLGSGFALASIVLFFLGKINMNIEHVAAFLSATCACASLLINYPKIKKRIKEIIKNFKI